MKMSSYLTSIQMYNLVLTLGITGAIMRCEIVKNHNEVYTNVERRIL